MTEYGMGKNEYRVPVSDTEYYIINYTQYNMVLLPCTFTLQLVKKILYL